MRVMRIAVAASSVLLFVGCGRSDRTLYPLGQGLTWEYQIAAGSMLGLEGEQRVTVTNLPQRDLSGRRVTPQKVDIGQQSHFSFVVSDQSGIYEYAHQPAGAVEPKILPTPSYYIKYPLKTGATWEGTTETNLLTKKVSISTHTTVESMDEAVTVPAGTFEHCVKTKTVGETSQNLGAFMGTARVTVEEYSWFCPGVGMVKAVRK